MGMVAGPGRTDASCALLWAFLAFARARRGSSGQPVEVVGGCFPRSGGGGKWVSAPPRPLPAGEGVGKIFRPEIGFEADGVDHTKEIPVSALSDLFPGHFPQRKTEPPPAPGPYMPFQPPEPRPPVPTDGAGLQDEAIYQTEAARRATREEMRAKGWSC